MCQAAIQVSLPAPTGGAELELEYPITDTIALFAHWEPVYSSEDWGSEGGKGWNHHIGTGVTFSF